MSIRIILADDHKIVRKGLRSLLERDPTFEVVGEAENGNVTLDLARQIKPDIVILDISMPSLNGIDTTQLLTDEFPDIKIIGLSMHFEKQFVSKMLNAGASGYLRKACAFEEVVQAIYTVLQDKFYISNGTSNITIKNKDQYLKNVQYSDIDVLTQREKDVTRLIAEGKLTKEIAVQLNLSIKTIEKHREHIMKKLDIKSIADLVKFAIRERLTSLEK